MAFTVKDKPGYIIELLDRPLQKQVEFAIERRDAGMIRLSVSLSRESARSVRDKLTEYLDGAADPMAWRPIATAPKDGTSVLLFEPWNPAHRVVVGWWKHGDELNTAKWFDGCCGVRATHWMPVPEPAAEA